MNSDCFSSPGEFYKGNLHMHSSRSDGQLSPKEVCKRYEKNGYDFIALTDHFVGLYEYPIVDTKEFQTNTFSTILGAEVHSGCMANGEIWHILAVGLPLDFKPPNAPHFLPVDDQESAQELAARCKAAGAFVAIAHPQWSGMTIEDAKSVAQYAHAVEIYNHGCAVDCDRPDGTFMLDLLLGDGIRLTAIATDDSHFKSNDYFGGWVHVKSKKNEPESLLTALKKGNFYSSCGPEIYNVEIKKKSIKIESSKASSIIVLGNGSASNTVHGYNLNVSEVSLEPFFNSKWIRAIIIDKDGKKAWTNPIWLKN